MDATSFLDALRARVPAATFEAVPSVDLHVTVLVPREHIVETLRVLRHDPELAFSLLVELTATDYLPREPRYEVVYHLVQLGAQDFPFPGPARAPARVRLKVPVPGNDARVPTASGVFANADWLEREVWDLFGIVFEGHPDLRRLLLSDDWEGYPLRKDYPVQVKVPYAASEPMQLTEQEFVENIDRLRQATTSRGPKK